MLCILSHLQPQQAMIAVFWSIGGKIFGQARYAAHGAIVEPEESLTKLSKATPWRRSTKEAELNAYVVIMLHGMVSHVRL